MLCNIQGWYKTLQDKDIAADADKRDISRFADEYKVPTCFVRSNFAKVLNGQFDKEFAKNWAIPCGMVSCTQWPSSVSLSQWPISLVSRKF